MKVVKTIAEMKQVRRQLPEPVGLVPTMGYLHEGHLTLVKVAKSENASAIATIFVNPTQFGPKEDFESYPRDPGRDLAMLETAGTDIVFMPEVEDMYPPNFDTWVVPDKVAKPLEGAARPNHFRGVDTVVAKLFNITEPTKAYFGQKDAQQCAVIKRMVADLNMNLEVVIVPTVRESDGLAMSSRNIYLKPDERKAAAVLHQALELAQKLYGQGERDAGTLREEMVRLIKKEPLTAIEYISVANPETLEELNGTLKGPALVSMVVKIGKPRLLDNVLLK